MIENRTVCKSDNQGVKEETFIQTSRRGTDQQPGGEDLRQGYGWRTSWSHSFMQKNWEEQLGSETDHTTQGSSAGKESLKPLAVKTCGLTVVGETASLTGEFVGETHRVLECTQTHPPGNPHQKGPICLWVAEVVTESLPRGKQATLFPP